MTAAGLGGRLDDGEEERRDDLCYPWDQNTLGIAGPLDDVPLEDLQQRFVTVANVQPRLATAHAKFISSMCLASSITPWESITNLHNRRRRNHF